MGTLMEIKEITTTYENGEMDIKTEGLQVFKILEVIKELPEKLFSGAIVTYPQNNPNGNDRLMKKVIHGIREIHKTLGVTKELIKPDNELTSFDVAHHAALSIEDEYQLLEFL